MITGTVERDSNNISALIWLTLALSLSYSPPSFLGVSVDSTAIAIFNNITLIIYRLGYEWAIGTGAAEA